MKSKRDVEDFPGRIEAWNAGLAMAINSIGRLNRRHLKELLPDLSHSQRNILRELCEAVIQDSHKIMAKIGGSGHFPSPEEWLDIQRTWEQRFTSLYPWVNDSNRDSIYSKCVYVALR